MGRAIGGRRALGEDDADGDAHGRHEGEDDHVDDGETLLGAPGDEFESHAEGDDEFVSGDGIEKVQHVGDVLLQANRQALYREVKYRSKSHKNFDY